MQALEGSDLKLRRVALADLGAIIFQLMRSRASVENSFKFCAQRPARTSQDLTNLICPTLLSR